MPQPSTPQPVVFDNSPLVEPLTPNLATVRGAHNFLFFLIIQSVLHSFMSCGLLLKHVLCHDSGLLKFNTARPLVPNSVGPLVLIPHCGSYSSVPLKFEIHSLGYTENTIGYSNSRKRFSLYLSGRSLILKLTRLRIPQSHPQRMGHPRTPQ